MVGDFPRMLRDWRRRRRFSQLELALRANASARHLSFLETGRARPSREMVLLLAEKLDVPLRARNALLLSAGFAPEFADRRADAREASATRALLDAVLAGHEPYPAVALDCHWNVVAANRAIAPLLNCVAPELRTPPVNVLRNSLHPRGMALRILNYAEWRDHLLARLQRQLDATADPVLEALYRELAGYSAPESGRDRDDGEDDACIAVPLRFQSPHGPLNLISATMVFGTAVDVGLAEVTLETFYPLDAETADTLRRISATLDPAAH